MNKDVLKIYKYESKEELLAFVLSFTFHLSAFAFRRSAFRFDPLMKVISDQDFPRRYALNLGVDDVVFLEGNSVKIRRSIYQGSSVKGIFNYAAPEYFRSNNYILNQCLCLKDEQFEIGRFLESLYMYSHPGLIARILSTWSPAWPLKRSVCLYKSFLLHPRTPISIAFVLIARAMFQRPVWKFKLLLSPKFP
jgi:hypothetical protein